MDDLGWVDDDAPHPADTHGGGESRADIEFAETCARIEAVLATTTDEGVAKALRSQITAAKRKRDRAIAKGLSGGLRVVQPDEVAQIPSKIATIEWDEVIFDEVATNVSRMLVEHGIDVFERSNGIVEIDRRGAIRSVGPIRMRDIIAGSMLFMDCGKPVVVPEIVPKTICDRPNTGLRELTAVIRAPTLRSDGSILESPGYDRASGLYYLRDSLTHAPMVQSPTREQAEAALAYLLEPLQDFPFIEPEHKAGAVAYLMTCVLRSAIDAPVPGFAFDAPSPGTGKTLLASMGGWVAHGESPPISQYTHDVEEQGKRVQSTLAAGVPLVIWDNIVHKFGSEVTDALLTSRLYTARILGQSKMPVYVNNTVWTFNGNNLRLNNADTIRRLIWIRMAYQKGDPAKRIDIRIDNLMAWVLERRKHMIRACITIARWGVLNPNRVDRYASFEDWSAMVRAPVMALMGADPCQGASKDDPDIHEEGSAISALFREWQLVRCGMERLAITEPAWTIHELLKHEQIADAAAMVCDDPNKRGRLLGEAFKRWRGRPVTLYNDDGSEWHMVRLVSEGKPGNKGKVYNLEEVKQ